MIGGPKAPKSVPQRRCARSQRSLSCARNAAPRRAAVWWASTLLQPQRRRAKMGFGAGDIKDKFRTYDGDADKRLRKKLEKSGKFDESFKTPVRIEKINVEVMGRWVAERLAELLGFEDDVLSELVMNMCDSVWKFVETELQGDPGRADGVWECRRASTPSPRRVPAQAGSNARREDRARQARRPAAAPGPIDGFSE